MRIGSHREAQIQQICHERGIKTLVHFTRVENLSSILQNGLLSCKALEILEETRGQQFLSNDQDRIDGHKEAICLSVSFPNYQMFYKYRLKIGDEHWGVLLLNAKILWELECAFCQRNAAHKTVTSIPLEERKKPEALKGIFKDFYNIKHQDLQIPNNYPTYPQAEILVFNQIPVRYINAVHFRGSTVLKEWQDENSGIYSVTPVKLVANRKYFKPRPDYEVWRSPNFNVDHIPEFDEYLGEFPQNQPDDFPISRALSRVSQARPFADDDETPFYDIYEFDEYPNEFVDEDDDDIPF